MSEPPSVEPVSPGAESLSPTTQYAPAPSTVFEHVSGPTAVNNPALAPLVTVTPVMRIPAVVLLTTVAFANCGGGDGPSESLVPNSGTSMTTAAYCELATAGRVPDPSDNASANARARTATASTATADK